MFYVIFNTDIDTRYTFNSDTLHLVCTIFKADIDIRYYIDGYVMFDAYVYQVVEAFHEGNLNSIQYGCIPGVFFIPPLIFDTSKYIYVYINVYTFILERSARSIPIPAHSAP